VMAGRSRLRLRAPGFPLTGTSKAALLAVIHKPLLRTALLIRPQRKEEVTAQLVVGDRVLTYDRRVE
jgi:hypothetical protein